MATKPTPSPQSSDPRTPSSVLLRRLLKTYILKHKRRLLLAIGCMVVAASMTATNAWLMQPVLDEIFVKRDTLMLTLIPIAIMIVAVVNGLASYHQTIYMRYIGQRTIADMQLDLFSHLMRADLGTFHDQASGRLISKFTNDIMMMRHAISNVLVGVAKESLTMLFLIGVMLYQSVELSLLAVVAFPIAILPIARLGRRMRKVSDSTQAELGEFTAQLDENFQGVRVVKAYGRESFEMERARQSIDRLFGLYFKAARIQAISAPMMETLGAAAIAAVIWYGGYQVVSGDTTPGAFFSFITSMLLAYKPMKSLAGLNTNLQEGLAAANRFFAAMDTQPCIQDAPHAKPLALSRGALALSDVSFHYGSEKAGVDNISITIEPGATAALVGPSGSGKSTLINLILRFYDVENGHIRIDGQDIRDVTLSSLRQSIALVSQDVVLFDDTVRTNIAYGRLDATQADIIEAAKRADAHEFILQMPQGYDTIIGPHGVKLSGGQRQRISIARAILKNAPILLLDEATSSLDTQSERSVQSALDSLMQQRTTLVIAHRLSTVQHADIIYVMEQGRLIESGTHDMLLSKGGRYHDLYRLQFAPARQDSTQG